MSFIVLFMVPQRVLKRSKELLGVRYFPPLIPIMDFFEVLEAVREIARECWNE